LTSLTASFKDCCDARLPLLVVETLGEDFSQLLRGVDPDQAEMTILDYLVGEVLADVNVLRTLTAADDVVAPFDARDVVFVDCVHLFVPCSAEDIGGR
jgi:hypothetical protein